MGEAAGRAEVHPEDHVGVEHAQQFAHLAQPVLVNGEAGALFGPREKPIAVIGFTIAGGRVAALNLIADTAKLQRLAIQP